MDYDMDASLYVTDSESEVEQALVLVAESPGMNSSGSQVSTIM